MFRDKRLIIAVFGGAILLIIIFISDIFRPQPPLEEIQRAREIISEIKSVKSDIYSPQYFNKAVEQYDKAMRCWQKENKKFIFRRNYDSLGYLSQQAIDFGNKAKSESMMLSSGLRWHIRNEIDSIADQKSYFQNIFNKIPLPENIQRQNARGFLLLHEAKLAFEDQKYNLSEEKLLAARESISYSYDYAFRLLNDYFMGMQAWQETAKETIDKSQKNKTTVVVIDKFARQCYLYSSGKLKYIFPVELGTNWMTDKLYKGDKATPEGNYKIIRKLSQPKTKYYKALLIDYPNEKDKKQFDKAKKSNALPQNADIGGLIEIHGHGDKGTDWTNGCIALKNEDIDVLFRETKAGSAVTIVGSLKPINEILTIQEENEEDLHN